jgi:hypothetical protein
MVSVTELSLGPDSKFQVPPFLSSPEQRATRLPLPPDESYRISHVKTSQNEQGYPEYIFLTKSQEMWNVTRKFFDEQGPIQKVDPQKIEYVKSTLRDMQDVRGMNPSHNMHTQTTELLRTNWHLFSALLDPRSNDQENFPEAFIEVDFGQFKGLADLVGTHNNSLYVVEVCLNKKTNSVNKAKSMDM